MPDGAEDLAATGDDGFAGLAFERMAEGVVGGQEEPRVAAVPDQRLAGAVREGGGVVGPVDAGGRARLVRVVRRSEEHTSELQSLMRISYAVFCLKKKK